jgi:hypothetical protein
MSRLINILLRHQVTVISMYMIILIYVDIRPSYVSFGPLSHTNCAINVILPFSLMTVSFLLFVCASPTYAPEPAAPRSTREKQFFGDFREFTALYLKKCFIMRVLVLS